MSWHVHSQVPDDCHALESRALFLKQLECLGAPLWPYEMYKCYRMFDDPDKIHELVHNALNSKPESGDFGEIVKLSEHLNRPLKLSIWGFFTDKGGTEQGHEGLNKIDFGNSLFDLHFRHWCMHHGVHLIVKRQLERWDAVHYFSSLAKIANVWRSGTNASKLKAVFKGDSDEHAKQVLVQH
eukprot:12428340-Karenia_brevis.AAC.1